MVVVVPEVKIEKNSKVFSCGHMMLFSNMIRSNPLGGGKEKSINDTSNIAPSSTDREMDGYIKNKQNLLENNTL